MLSYEYEINDYAGNEQSKKETIDGGTALGEYKTRMPDGQLQVVTYESGPNGHLASVKYESGAAAPPLYGTGAEKPLYGAVRPYVRTSSDVKYIKMARPSYPSHPFYAMSRPAYAKPGHQATYATAYEPSRRSYRGPRPTYTSPTVPPYAPAVYHRSYGTKYPAADSMY